jgi:hypothetical protein
MGQAAATLVAVEEGLPPSHSADATALTVEDALGLALIIKEVAGGTEPAAQHCAAARAGPGRALLQAAQHALDAHHQAPVQGVSLLEVSLLL